MLLQLMKYDLEVKWVPGKDMHIADALSRAFTDTPSGADQKNTLNDETELRVHSLVEGLPISNDRLQQVKDAVSEDESLQVMMKILMNGWPKHKLNVPKSVREYWPIRDEIHQADGLIFVGEKLLIPESLRSLMLMKIHETHQGVEKCRSRARSCGGTRCLSWPCSSPAPYVSGASNRRSP